MATGMNIKKQSRIAQHTSLLLALALLLILASYQGLAASAVAQPPALAPAPTATLAAGEDGDRRPDPFPVAATEAMTETIAAALASFEQRIATGRAGDIAPIAIPASGTLIYVPHIVRSQATPGPAPEPPPSPTPRPQAPAADLAVTIWPEPSIRVARDALLIYEIRVRNYGAGPANLTRVTLPYTTTQLTVIGGRFTRAGDWISELTNERVTVTFAPIGRESYQTAAIVFRVNPTLADNTVLSMRAIATWSDARRGGSGFSNWAPVLVGGGNDSAAYVWLIVDPPVGTASTRRLVYSDRFIPGEGIYTWLNTARGPQPLDLRGQADPLGRIALEFRPAELAPGTYQMVVYGARSRLTGGATFTVQ